MASNTFLTPRIIDVQNISPLHAKVRALASEEAADTPPDYVYRTIGKPPALTLQPEEISN